MTTDSDRSGVGAVLFTTDPTRLARFYERVVGLRPVRVDADHVVLETAGFRLIVHRIPERHARGITISEPAVVRERGAVKLCLPVDDLASARRTAAEQGGEVYPPGREWRYGDATVCDGYDPDGNVFQLVQARRTRP